MNIRYLWPLLAFFGFLNPVPGHGAPETSDEWTVLICNDTCPDYTWANDEPMTRLNFSNLTRAHLDEMVRTDHALPDNRDHYTMITEEALCFLERYPERKGELLGRIKEGRIMLSPNLNNSLWGFQSIESAIRNLYPARRLQREAGIPLDVLHHIEYPGLPWGVATILSGCGVRWLTVAFLPNYDSTLSELKSPPVFRYEGPDGSQLRVVMDPWASRNFSYDQGLLLIDPAKALKHPHVLEKEWIPHYRDLGKLLPRRTILMAGTHADTRPESPGEAHSFANSIIAQNADPARPARLINGTYAQFCRLMDEAERQEPFMPILRGSFGDSWEAWAVSLAKYAAATRENERSFLAAETLIALAGLQRPALYESTRSRRERAEWLWTMLADHAWNGASDQNRIENARLRHVWNEELGSINRDLWSEGWAGLDLAKSSHDLTVFNSLGWSRNGLVRVPASDQIQVAFLDGTELPSQTVVDEGRPYLYFVLPLIDGFAFKQLTLGRGPAPLTGNTPSEINGTFYRLKMDLHTGGLASVVYKPTGAELVDRTNGRSLGQTVFFDGQERPLGGITASVEAAGPVCTRLRVEGTTAGINVTTFITLYAELDRIDFDVRVHKPVSTEKQRLVQIFPVIGDPATLRVETTAAVIRPERQPAGDLQPGANTQQCAVQGFVDISATNGTGVTIAPLDSFLLRQDLETVTFEALGNDQNYQEVTRNQGGVTDFRFRYSLRAHAGGYDNAAAVAWSREATIPLFAADGKLAADRPQVITVDPRRAITTCLKPADDPAANGLIVHFWETAQKPELLPVTLRGWERMFRTDLLERDLEELPIDRQTAIAIRPRGLASLRLEPKK